MKYEIGVFGLGVMGASIAKNILHKGFSAALYSVSAREKESFSASGNYLVCHDAAAFIQALEKPRKVFLMITAGKAVDEVLEQLLPYMDNGDVIIDGGNSHYQDTDRRGLTCQQEGIYYIGAGVSGGQKGALEGPSIMAGGSAEGYALAGPILERIAAVYGGQPCCGYVGPGGSGHYVKMVHNGIEYALLELLGETYALLKHGLGRTHEEIRNIFQGWRRTRLNSYLLDISVTVMEKKDEDGVPLIDKILDVAEQKGTGLWTVEEALRRGVYIPTIYEAVAARSFSVNKKMRLEGERLLPHGNGAAMAYPAVEEIEKALELAVLLSYSQGYELMAKASEENEWEVDLSILSRLWSNGCIIRGSVLTSVKAAHSGHKPLFTDKAFASLWAQEEQLRKAVCFCEHKGMAAAGYAASLHYYNYYRTADMPVRFVQALRDCFGAHTYRRTDRPGQYHTEWETEKTSHV